MKAHRLPAGSIERRRRSLLFGLGVALLLSLAILPGLPPSAPCSPAQCSPTGEWRRWPIDEWRPSARFRPLTDTQAANRVTPAVEIRPENREANAYVPSPAELRRFHAAKDESGATEEQRNPYLAAVTGHFAGTTDEIIQWAAHKWGIPENWLRAQYAVESRWNQSAVGDLTDVPPSERARYPAFSCPYKGRCYESVGISQVKWRPDGDVGAGTEPLRWRSTAFNVDFQAATVRFYYDDAQGRRSAWGDSSYRRGQAWLAVAGWYQPYPWGNPDQRAYARDVRRALSSRIWAQPGF